MPEQADLVAKITQVKGGRRFQSDITRIEEMEFPKRKLVELRSLFRFRLFMPQVEYRERFPDQPYSKDFFDKLMKEMAQWFSEVKDAVDSGEVSLGEEKLPTWEEIVAEAVEGGSATNPKEVAWFMVSRSEGTRKIGGLLRD